MSTLTPDSPCKGFCTTMLGDKVCKACGRTEEEVLNWIIYTDEEKQIVRNRVKDWKPNEQ